MVGGGYGDIQTPPKRNAIIDRAALRRLLGFSSDEQLQSAHAHWIEEALQTNAKEREASWSQALAVGRQGFVMGVQAALGIAARDRSIQAIGDTHVLREPEVRYIEGENSAPGEIFCRF